MKKKTVLVCGASGEIGVAVVSRFLSEQFQVVAVDIVASPVFFDRIDRRILGSQSSRLNYLRADLTVEAEVKKVVESAGEISSLVNLVGVAHDSLLVTMSFDNWNKVISTNLNSVYLCSKYAIRTMLRSGKGGTIVNFSSVAAISGNAGQVNYAAAKAGVIALTKSIAIEYAKKNIRANVVAPGLISTKMVKQIPKEKLERLISMVPTGRLGRVEEVANLVFFLSSRESSYITGEVFKISGGL